MNWTIGFGIGWMCDRPIGQCKQSSTANPGIWEDKVSSIRDKIERHVAGMIADCGTGVCVQVVKELVASRFCAGSGRGLLVGNFVKGTEYCWVYGSTVI